MAVVAVSAILASNCGGDSTQPGTPASSATQPAPADSPAPASSAAKPDDSSATKEEATADAAADTSEQVAAPIAVSGDVPDLELTDVATGDGVQLRSLMPADTPVLFWFWAPH